MISPEEIQQYAIKWWKQFLQSHVTGQPFFPKIIDRIGKIKSSQVLDDFKLVQDEVSHLHNFSKSKIGFGYVVKTTAKNFRRKGSHELPHTIEFESIDDYIKYIGKTKEWQTFSFAYKVVYEGMPQLKDWVHSNPEYLTVSGKRWPDILKVCHYFISNPRPQLYIRQLPIKVDTKFIENNETVLRSLLDFLIPDHIRNNNQKSFPERYYLKYDEPLQVRLRILDQQLAITHLTDLLIKVSDFEKMSILCKNVILTENKMNFLALPDIPNSIAIWSGGGFNISILKDIEWLKEKEIFYWGDIDIQGLQILHQMRSYYSKTRSIMMDKHTFEQFSTQAGDGKAGFITNLDFLTIEEKELFDFLKAKNIRLEQEKIPQIYVETFFKQIV